MYSRLGLQRAELICAACGYLFASALPEAILQGNTIAATLPPPEPPRSLRVMQPTVTVPRKAPTEPAQDNVLDFRTRAARADE
jgi:hypothetical protein